METVTFITLLATILGAVAILVSAARYFAQTLTQDKAQKKDLGEQKKEIEKQKREIERLKQQVEIFTTSGTLYSDVSNQTETIDKQILRVTTQAQNDVNAKVHSVSIPTPRDFPTHMTIYATTDPEATKGVVDRDFPIDESMIGWVYKNREPVFKERLVQDIRHYPNVDKSAGTSLAKGPVLCIPIVTTTGRCVGVFTAFRGEGGEKYVEQDIHKAARHFFPVSRLLLELEQNPQMDNNPYITRGDQKFVSVLFTDIREFSNVMSSLNLGASAKLLNEYYSRLLDVAFANNGKFEEYVGDGLYISFCLDTPNATARAAVNTALQMQEEYSRILDGWEKYQHPVSKINSLKIGVASGDIYRSMIGHPKERREKLIGSTINLAAHLCEDHKALANGILVCPRTAEILWSDRFIFSHVDSSLGSCFSVTKRVNEFLPS